MESRWLVIRWLIVALESVIDMAHQSEEVRIGYYVPTQKGSCLFVVDQYVCFLVVVIVVIVIVVGIHKQSCRVLVLQSSFQSLDKGFDTTQLQGKELGQGQVKTFVLDKGPGISSLFQFFLKFVYRFLLLLLKEWR